MTLPAEKTAPPANRSRRLAKICLGMLLLASLILAFRTLPIADGLRTATAWVESLGFWAPVAFVAIYVLAVILFVPASLLTAAAGTLFGLAGGSAVVSVASTLGATLAFLIGRTVARRAIESKIAGNRTFAAIDGAVEKEGWKIVGLTRLSPAFPFALLNYGYGLTKVRLRDYVLASWLGMLPGTVLYVYVGSLGRVASQEGGKSPAEWALLAVGLVATLVVTIVVTRIAKRALDARISG